MGKTNLPHHHSLEKIQREFELSFRKNLPKYKEKAMQPFINVLSKYIEYAFEAGVEEGKKHGNT